MLDLRAAPGTSAASRRRRRQALCLALLSAFVAVGSPPRADTLQVGELDLVDEADVPAAVRDATECDDARPNYVTRQSFADRVLFRVRCPGNNQNWVDGLVSAEDQSGRRAMAIVFPATPYSGGATLTELSNVRVFPDTRTIGEIYVVSEPTPGAPCRHESLFRFEDDTPRLVFHRSSTSCDEEPGMRWNITLDERTPAEKRDDWR